MEQHLPQYQHFIAPQPRESSERYVPTPAEKLYRAVGDRIQNSVDRLCLAAKHNPLETFFAQAEDSLIDNYNAIQTTRANIEHIGELDLGKSIRLDLYEKLLPQLLFLPGLFDYRATNLPAKALRERLIDYDGVYGLVTEHLPSAIHQFSQLSPGSEQASLIGSINELTALALYNRSQDANVLALPTLPRRDEKGKIDIQYYSYINNRPRHANFQVKSNILTEERIFGVRTLTGADLGNSTDNQFWPMPGKIKTARALTQEIRGTATDEQSTVLDQIVSHINDIALRELEVSRKPEPPFNLIKHSV